MHPTPTHPHPSSGIYLNILHFSLFEHIYNIITNSRKVKVTQSCPTLCDPMVYTVRDILQARILEWEDFPFSRDLSNPGIEPRSPALWADSSPAEPQGKPKNTEVSSPSLLQQIFLTQESNWGLLLYRTILYQLSW